MKMMEAVKTCFHKYVKFSGRARRSEYWKFALFNILVTFVLTLIASLVAGMGSGAVASDSAQGAPGIVAIYSLVILLPTLSVGVRRLHDIGKSGWSYLIQLIPLVGSIIFLVWLCKDSEPGENVYGRNPKEPSTKPIANPTEVPAVKSTTAEDIVKTPPVQKPQPRVEWNTGSDFDQ